MVTEKVILKSLPKVLKTVDLPLGKKIQGKVRDIYFKDKKKNPNYNRPPVGL